MYRTDLAISKARSLLESADMLHPARNLTFLVPALLIVGCGSDNPSQSGSEPDVIASSLTRELNPQPTSQQLQALAEGNHALTLDLYRETASDDGNYMISTLSIRTAFAMVYAGARNTTADEMVSVLRFDPDQARLHEAMNALDLALQSRQLEADQANGLDPLELRQANAFWGRVGFPWRPSYLDVLAVNYGAAVRPLDFAAAPEPSRMIINDWVEQQTNDRIQDLLPDGSIGTDTVAVLTNAVYFKAPWVTPFDPFFTRTGTFNRVDGTAADVDYMTQLENLPYASGPSWQAVELPYRGGELSMVLLIPDPGAFATFDAALTAEQVTSAVENLQVTQVDLTLPKFEFETDFILSAALKSLGMTAAFSGGADLTGMVEGGGLKIDEAYHKTFVAVDEYGTEAAAATAVVIVKTSAPTPEVTLTLDRPFYFLIRDRQTDVWLFFGRVMDPSAS